MHTHTHTHSDTFIQKTKKLYMDSRANRNNLKMMSEDLRDIQGIMTKNIQEVLGRGEKLESEFMYVCMCVCMYVLMDVHGTMTKNIQEVLGRGEELESEYFYVCMYVCMYDSQEVLGRRVLCIIHHACMCKYFCMRV